MATRNPRKSLNGLMHDYSQLRAVPALLGIVFGLASLYQFGGISEVTIEWFNYELTSEHGMFVSLGVLVVAFMSSQTKQFENYETWEQVLIAASPGLIIAHHFSDTANDIIMTTSDPWSQVGAFVICLAGYGAAMR